MFSVLIVEDEERIRTGLVHSFPWESVGCTVVGEASNGLDGVDRIQELNPDLVLTDINMPVMNGIKMLEQTIDQFRYVAIVLSVYSEFEYAQAALRLGAFDFLVKPLDNDELIASIQKAFPKLKQHRDSNSTYSEELIPSFTTGHRRVKRMLEFIENSYREKISISDISAELNTSPGYLNTLFKEDSGFTFNAYLNRYRISKAMDLMQSSDVKLYEIAETVGFPEYKYFVYVFKKLVGVTPSEYVQTLSEQT